MNCISRFLLNTTAQHIIVNKKVYNMKMANKYLVGR